MKNTAFVARAVVKFLHKERLLVLYLTIFVKVKRIAPMVSLVKKKNSKKFYIKCGVKNFNFNEK